MGRNIVRFALLCLTFCVLGSAVVVQASTYPNRTVSPLLKPGTYFTYHYHAAFLGQEKDADVNITITSMQGQQISFSASSSAPDLIVNSGIANVGDLGSGALSYSFPFIGTNLNVGDPVVAVSGQSPYTIQTISDKEILGQSRTISTFSVTTTTQSPNDSQVVMEWDREGGFPTLITLTITSQSTAQSISIALIHSNVFPAGNDNNWLSALLVEVGTFVNSILNLNVNPLMLGFITLLCAAVVLVLGIWIIIWLLS